MAAGRTIAVLVTSYNSKTYIGETLASISSQRRLPDQVMIADDGSTDGTAELIADWAARQPFEVVIRPKRVGNTGSPARGRQWGLENTRADLVSLLDHDDLFIPKTLERLAAAFHENPAMAFCFGDTREFHHDPSTGVHLQAAKRATDIRRVFPSGVRELGDGVFCSLLRGSYIPTSATLFRRDFALESGGFAEAVGSSDDALLWMRLCRRGPVGHVPEVISCRRLHPDNLSWNSLRAGISAYKARRQAIQESDVLGLTIVERRQAQQTAEQLLPQIAYHASKAGLRKYLQTTRDLQDRIRPRPLLVSLCVSLAGNLLPAQPVRVPASTTTA